MSTGDEGVEPEPVPAEVAARIVRAIDRSPSAVVTLVEADLSVRWISHSATWVTGTDPSRRKGVDSLERIHPDDVERLLHGLGILRAAAPTDAPTVPVAGPLRYRFQRLDGRWVVMEAMIHNLLGDPLVRGLLVESRPVEDGFDGVGHVVDLLVADAPLREVLRACAGLVPAYLGSAAVVAFIGGESVTSAPDAGAAHRLIDDDRWWRDAVVDARPRAPVDLTDLPRELAHRTQVEGVRSVWVFPLVEESSADVMGCVVICLQVDLEFNIAVDDSLRQTRRLARLVIAEERRRHALRRLAATDPLTGLANRSALERRLDEASGPVALALIDLDDFKPVNDTHGHDIGDAVLQTVARRLAGAVRADDLVVRFGGDEFAVVFSDETTPEVAARVIERITTAIEAPIALDGSGTITIGASAGLATADPDKVVRLADTALYEAKRRP